MSSSHSQISQDTHLPKSRWQVTSIIVFVSMVLGFFEPLVAVEPEHPVWWSSGVTNSEPVQNLGAVNIGQLKNVANVAHQVLENILPDGAGYATPFTAPETPSAEWYADQKKPANLGQLKACAKPFYDRINGISTTWVESQLQLNGLSTLGTDYFQDSTSGYFYPWDPTTPVAENFKLTTLGQLKLVFALRINTLEVVVENPDDLNGNGIPDALEAALNGIQMTGDARYLPRLQITDTWEVTAKNYTGERLANQLLSFEVIRGSGSFSGGGTTTSLSTDAAGVVNIDNFGATGNDRIRVTLSTSLGNAIAYLPSSVNGASPSDATNIASGLYEKVLISNPIPPEDDDVGGGDDMLYVKSLSDYLSIDYVWKGFDGSDANGLTFDYDVVREESTYLPSSVVDGEYNYPRLEHTFLVGSKIEELDIYINSDLFNDDDYQELNFIDEWNVQIFELTSESHEIDVFDGNFLNTAVSGSIQHQNHINFDVLDGEYGLSIDVGDSPNTEATAYYNTMSKHIALGAQVSGITVGEHNSRTLNVPQALEEDTFDKDEGSYKSFTFEYPYGLGELEYSYDFKMTFTWDPDLYMVQYFDEESAEWVIGGNGEIVIDAIDNGINSFLNATPTSCDFKIAAKEDAFDENEAEFTMKSEYRPNYYFDEGADEETISGDPIELETVSINLQAQTSNPPSSRGLSLNVNTDETSSPKYRKIGLNGLPISDTKPQADAENDEESEETYIDALSLDLQHSTTDIYIPVPSSDLALSVRRNATSTTWTKYSGLRPSEQPDAPFGAAWSSNLTSYVVFNEQTDTAGSLVADFDEIYRKENGLSQSSPNTATVIDENGSAYSFIISYSGGGRTFSPTPTAKTQLPSYMATLTETAEGYTFKKKYGTTLTFSGGPTFDVANNRVEGSKQQTQSSYNRLTRVADRAGNALVYSYEDGDNLIPNTIAVEGLPSLRINIAHDISGRVNQVQDANGNIITYNYASADMPGSGVGQATVSVLKTVIRGSSVQSTYGYSTFIEDDHKASSTPDGFDLRSRDSDDNLYSELTGHVNLASIDGPYLDDTISFEYELDLSRRPYISKPEYVDGSPTGLYLSGNYALSGMPRNVKKITLPGDRNTMISGNHTISSNASGDLDVGSRQTTVTDPENNERVYSWGAYTLTTIPPAKLSYLDKDVTSISKLQLLGMKAMGITYSGGGVSGSESFTFDPLAGYAPLSVTDFSGNITSYTYSDPVTNHAYGMNHSDPSAQTDADGNTKSFTYDSSRIMTEITDELGRRTVYTLDETSQVSVTGSLARRTTETKYDENDNELTRTKFYYQNASFPTFMTKRVTEAYGLNATEDPDWVTDLTTFYEPDAYGRVATEISDLNGDGVSDAGDITTSFSYDLNGNKLSATDANGYQTGFTYDSQNRLTQIDSPDGTQKTIVYDLRSKKVLETDGNGISTGYDYDNTGRLVRTIRDMNGNLSFTVATNTFSGIDTEDLVTSVTYNDVNSPLTTTDARGYVTAMEYDGLQRPVKIITPEEDTEVGVIPTTTGYVTTLEYSTAANTGGSAFNVSGFKPTKITDPRGYDTYAVYDSLYRPTYQWKQYEKGTEPKYAIALTEYDALGNVLQSSSWRTPADALGVLYSTSSADVQALTTQTTYDSLNRPISVTKALGSDLESIDSTSYTSTGFAYYSVQEIENGITRDTFTEFDPVGRPVTTRGSPVYDPISNSQQRPVTTTTYDANGNVLSTTNPLANTWDFLYDVRNRKIQEIQPAVFDIMTGQTIQPVSTMAYDAVGNIVSTTDARLFTSTTEYDAAYRVTRAISPSVYINGGTETEAIETSQTYDENGNVLTLTDPNGSVTVNTYDALGRLTTTTTNPTTAASSTPHADDITVFNTYDASGNLLAVTDGEGQVTGFSYDGLNRKLQTIWDMGDATREKVEETIYDAMLATEQRNPNEAGTTSFTYHYDARFRLSSVEYPTRSSDNRSMAYDLADRKLSVTHPNAADTLRDTSYVYDFLDRTTSETSAGVIHSYEYDLAGNSTTTSYGNNGKTLISTYDALNRLVTLTESGRTTEYRYDLAGNIVEKELPSGQISLKGYDALGRTAFISNETDTATINSFDYQYDALGNVTQVDETYPSGALPNRSVINSYDNLNRLISESIDDNTDVVTTIYGYDDANNRISKDVTGGGNAGSTAYTYGNDINGYNANQLVSYVKPNNDNVTLSYDANGSRATKTVNGTLTQTYAYDINNRLISVLDEDLGSFSYQYDGRTRRVLRDETSASGDQTHLSFSTGLSVQEYDGGTTTSASPDVEHIRGSDYGGGIGGILYTLRGGSPSYNTYNSRGDVVSKSDTTGSVTWEAAYEAFGTRTAENGSTEDRQKANTKDEDPTGLLNEGMRYRDLETGMFMTRDPAGFVDGPNVYTYVRQNPWTMIDPLGLWGDDPYDQVYKDEIGYTTEDEARVAIASIKILGTLGASMITGVGELQDGEVIADKNSKDWEKSLASGSLALSAWTGGVSPNAGGVIKAIRKLFGQTDAAADGANTALKTVEANVEQVAKLTDDKPRFITDENGLTVDTHSTPQGSYIQKDGSRTDILQAEDHGAGLTHTHEVNLNTNPSTGETFVNGKKPPRPVSAEDVKSIEDGTATIAPAMKR